MRVEMTFSDEAMAEAGLNRNSVYSAIRKEFEDRGLVCVSEDSTLAFEDADHEDDYANMWNMILNLMVSDWFHRCATSLNFIEDDEVEDVLSQAWKLKEHGVAIR